MGFWDSVKAMRKNSRPLYKPQAEAESTVEMPKPAEIKLFEPLPDKEVGGEQKAVKKALKRKETAVSDNDD